MIYIYIYMYILYIYICHALYKGYIYICIYAHLKIAEHAVAECSLAFQK